MPHAQPPAIALNPEQQAAVERENQDVCVVAGPGSGKTRVLVERFAWLTTRGVDPERILAITFTEKAATELKERLASRFQCQPEKRRQIERAQISTIHGFCHAILREHALAAGLDPQFELLDDLEAASLRNEAMQEALDDIARQNPRKFLCLAEVWPANSMDESLLAAYDAMRAAGKISETLEGTLDADALIAGLTAQFRTHLANAAAFNKPTTDARKRRLAVIQALLERLDILTVPEITAEFSEITLTGERDAQLREEIELARGLMGELKGAWALKCFLPQRELLLEILRRFHDLAREKRRSAGLLDFSDLEEYTLDLLRTCEPIRRSISERFEHILMDELQDTNPIQWKILSLVRRPGRFFAVGDVNQSIYSFRHAEPQLFRHYERSVSGHGWIVDRLENNYRTRGEILDAVSRILVSPHQPGIEPHALRAAAAFPPATGPCVEILCADRTADPETDVLLWLAARLIELHGSPLAGGQPARFDDMAVFVRNTSSFAAVENALRRFSIPYVVAGGKSFFDAIEVVDVLNALRVLARPEDDIALFALLRSPFFGRSDEELLLNRIRIRTLASDEDAAFLARMRESLDAQPASLVLARLIDETGYSSRLTAGELANVEKLLSLIDHAERRQGRDVQALLDHIESLQNASSEAHAPALEAGDAVRLMTIHKAKGLEFPIVAIADLQKRERSNTEAALYHPECGLGFKWLCENNEAVGDFFFTKVSRKLTEKNELERDRLLYVALTRAKERLVLSFSYSRSKTGNPSIAAWPRLVLERLGLRLPAEPNTQSISDLAVLTRVAGDPEIPEAPHSETPAAPPEFDPPSPPRQAPAEIAVTALATFARCPRRYLLDSVLHWPLPPAGGEGAMALGTEVHEFLAGLRTDVSDEARELAQAFGQSALNRRAAQAASRHQEMDFLVEIGGALLRGQIDLWFDEGGGPVLVDYKTDRYLSEERMRGYELQLRFYALALQKLTGEPVREAWLVPLREPEPHAVDISEPALQSALDVLRQWRAAEESGEFPVNEAPDCQWCPYASGPCPVQRPAGPGL